MYVVGICRHHVTVAGVPLLDATGTKDFGLAHRASDAIDFATDCAEWLERGLTLNAVESKSVMLSYCPACLREQRAEQLTATEEKA